MSAFIRLTLTAALLFMVYRETGPWTVATLAIMALGMELSAWLHRKIHTKIRTLCHIRRNLR